MWWWIESNTKLLESEIKMENVVISKGNSKMGNVLSVSLPQTSCREDAPCKKYCYANKGAFLYSSVQKSYKNNLDLFNSNPKRFEQSILEQIPMYGVFRWHVAGDILNERYFDMMISLAKKLKHVKFLCFTKKYELVNKYLETKKIPSNLKIVFSAWMGLELKNPNNFPVAYVYSEKNIDSRIPKTALPCSGNCANCMVCWSLRKRQSVVFHMH